MALINRFKLYLVKTYSKTPKKQKKQNVNKNNAEYILHLHLVNVTWCHPGWHNNVSRVGDIIMSPGWLWSGEHMIMLNVTWRRFDQSVKQLIVGHTTKEAEHRLVEYVIFPLLKKSISDKDQLANYLARVAKYVVKPFLTNKLSPIKFKQLHKLC